MVEMVVKVVWKREDISLTYSPSFHFFLLSFSLFFSFLFPSFFFLFLLFFFEDTLEELRRNKDVEEFFVMKRVSKKCEV